MSVKSGSASGALLSGSNLVVIIENGVKCSNEFCPILNQGPFANCALIKILEWISFQREIIFPLRIQVTLLILTHQPPVYSPLKLYYKPELLRLYSRPVVISSVCRPRNKGELIPFACALLLRLLHLTTFPLGVSWLSWVLERDP